MKKTNRQNSYQKTQIMQRGQLKQFAGSPLGKKLGNPLGLPGQE